MNSQAQTPIARLVRSNKAVNQTVSQAPSRPVRGPSLLSAGCHPDKGSNRKPVKLFDERGRFLIITPAGGRWWRFRYKLDGKEKLLSLGVYPDVRLKDARTRRDEARKLLADGVDPGEHRKAAKAAKAERGANSFEVVTREWFNKYSPGWAEHHGNRILRRFVGAELESALTAHQT